MLYGCIASLDERKARFSLCKPFMFFFPQHMITYVARHTTEFAERIFEVNRHRSTNWIVCLIFMVAITAFTSLGTSPRYIKQQAMYFPWVRIHFAIMNEGLKVLPVISTIDSYSKAPFNVSNFILEHTLQSINSFNLTICLRMVLLLNFMIMTKLSHPLVVKWLPLFEIKECET